MKVLVLKCRGGDGQGKSREGTAGLLRPQMLVDLPKVIASFSRAAMEGLALT